VADDTRRLGRNLSHAKVDPEGCVACATCVKVCPYGAPMINDLKKAEIQGATCMGCGSCAAACPARTITLQHQEDGGAHHPIPIIAPTAQWS
jgi:Heterodisulfide reductase, subunit A and related polyferredoxins